ncbi:MAG: type III pantothenate kinase [Abditibacteriota bacterium]|nr:type III pantothenate kinase [Abditibacteriota bacterium]
MLLAIDVGNTNITFGIYGPEGYICDFRVNTHPFRTADEYAALLKTLMSGKGVDFSSVHGIIISSVVPFVNEALVRFSKKHFGISEPIMLSADIDTGVRIAYNPANGVGADRIANAAAAHHYYPGYSIVVDFGTANTFDVIDKNGDYLGGAITPGIQISLDSLFAKASKLTQISLDTPKKAIGTDTESALMSGIIYGYSGQVDSIVSKICEELPEKPAVIATGGQSYLIAEHARTIEHVDDKLTLNGLFLIYKHVKGI